MPESSGLAKPNLKTQDGTCLKTMRMAINLLTHILMCFTVFVCVVYACSFNKLTLFHWHIILCVLGYQFFMGQGMLVISRYNSWSIHLNRGHRKYLHTAFQVIGFVLIIAGSWTIVCEKSGHFETIHGSLGLCAVITSTISVLNGVSANYAYKLSSSYVLCIRYIHYLSGILTLFLSAASLSAAFQGSLFRIWVSNDDAVAVLVFVTWVFTLLVALDFWVLTGNRLRNFL